MLAETLPPGWIKVSLRDVTDSSVERLGGGEVVPVLSSTKYRGLVPSDEYFGRRIYSHDLSNYKVVRCGWFAYATNHLAEGSIGLQSQYEKAVVSPMYRVFEVCSDVEPGFLLRILKSQTMLAAYKRLEKATVDRRGSIRYDEFAELTIHLPPLTEQRRIADILDTADAAIQQTEALIAKLKLMRAGLLHDLLTRGLDGYGELRDPVAHPKQFKETPLGLLPREWDVEELGKVARVRRGASPRPIDSPVCNYSGRVARAGRVAT